MPHPVRYIVSLSLSSQSPLLIFPGKQTRCWTSNGVLSSLISPTHENAASVSPIPTLDGHLLPHLLLPSPPPAVPSTSGFSPRPEQTLRPTSPPCSHTDVTRKGKAPRALHQPQADPSVPGIHLHICSPLPC